MSPCKFFLQGLCWNGDTCPFYHSQPLSAVLNGSSDADEREPEEPVQEPGWGDPPSVPYAVPNGLSDVDECEPEEPVQASGWDDPPSVPYADPNDSRDDVRESEEPVQASGWDDPPSVPYADPNDSRDDVRESEEPVQASGWDDPPSVPYADPNDSRDDVRESEEPVSASGWDDLPSENATEIAVTSSNDPPRVASLQATPQPEGSFPNTSLTSPRAVAFEPCTFRMTGRCLRGDSCVVDHGEHFPIHSPIPSHTSPLMGELKGDDGDWIQFSETAIARATDYTPPPPVSGYLPQGMCNMGFMHGSEPVYSSTTFQDMRPCKYFAFGTCRKANECPLVHDIRAQPAHNGRSDNGRSNGLCRFYRDGRCWKGSTCRFRHDSDDLPLSPRPNRADPEPVVEQSSGWLAQTDDWGLDPQLASQWVVSDSSESRQETSWGENGESNWAVKNPPKEDLYEPAPVVSDTEPTEEMGANWLADTDPWAVDPADTPKASRPQEGVVDESKLDWFQEVEESRTIHGKEESWDSSSTVPAPPVVVHTLNGAADDEPREPKSHNDGVDNIAFDRFREDDETKWGLPDPTPKLRSIDSLKHDSTSQNKSGWRQEIDESDWSMEQQLEESYQAQEDRTLDTNPAPRPSDNVHGGLQNSMLCVFFQQNRCSQGDNCRFSHILVPCSFFRQGTCKNGNSCRFHHEANAGDRNHERFSGPPVSSQIRDAGVGHSENTETGWLQTTDLNSEWQEWGTQQQGADDWLAPASDTSAHHGTRGWPDAARSSAKDVEAEDAWHERTIRPSDASVALPEPERELPPQSIYHCTVRFGPGAIPEDVLTPFDSRAVVLSDYPLGIDHNDLLNLAEPYGVVKDTTFRVTPGGMRARIEFEQYSQAAEARLNLNGTILDDSVMHAQLDSIGSVGGNIHEPGRQLKLVWDAPSISAWVFYPTVGVAKAESARLNGIMYGERKISAEYRKAQQAHSIPVLLQFLPLNVQKEELHKFCVKSSSVSLNTPNYRGSQRDNILAYLTRFGPVEFLEVLPTDPAHLEITGLMEFATAKAAVDAIQALKKTKHHDFLGKGGISAQPIVYSKYDCSRCPFNLVREDIERLSAPAKCTIRCYDQPPRVHIYGSDAEAVAKLRKSVQDSLFGSEVTIWDPYFDTPSSDEAIKHINIDTSFHLQRDERRQVLRVWGNQEQAERKITRLLKAVQGKRHFLPIDEGSIPALIRGGLQSLQDAFGASKILLDIRARLITVLGDTKTDVESRLKALPVACSSPGTGKCCLCLLDAVEPVALACSHIYCVDCLKFLLCPIPGIEFNTPACVGRIQGGSCLEPIAIRTIASHLSDPERKTLFKLSLLSFIRSEPNYRFCSSGCPVVYRLGIKGTIYTCPECNLDLCASCADPVHTGMTCDDYEGLRTSGFES
ncbi:hypothetical protein C8R45DRAFT_1084797 [Mycena sanguinolenta]|nr:hypothetical protein C8R45DRAFT_1084797 [Mycena sanguinolenta]